LVTAVLATVWLFRDTVLQRRLPGDIGDARWSTAITEHWYQVWTGHEAVRDLRFFFPEHRTLGASDAMFFQGQVHTIARAMGAGLVGAWLIAQVATFLVGAIGVAFLSTRVLRSTYSRVAFVALSCASYPMLVQVGHVQSYAYLWVAWLLVGICDLHNAASDRGARRGLVLLLVVPAVLVVTSYYALALGSIVLGTLGIMAGLFHDRSTVVSTVRRFGGRAWLALRTPLGVGASVVAVLVWVLAAWIYLPARNVLPAPTWNEVVFYSPRWQDIANASADGGGLWGWLYDRIFGGDTINFERLEGFTPVLLVAFVVVGIFAIRAVALRHSDRLDGAGLPGARGLLAAWCTVPAVLVIFLTNDRGFALFKILWTAVAAFQAVRAPFRVQLLLYPLAVYVVLRAIEIWAEHQHLSEKRDRPNLARAGRFVAVLTSLVGLVIFVEMQRQPEFWWAPSQLLDASLRSDAGEIVNRCSALIVSEDRPAEETIETKTRVGPAYLEAIDAVVLAELTGVPTPQGYSRDSPIGHPGVLGSTDSLIQWSRSRGFTGPICVVSASGVQVER
jgi:hypothetical protein